MRFVHVVCRQDDVQPTAAQEVVEDEVDEFEAIEKLDQLGINRGTLLLISHPSRPVMLKNRDRIGNFASFCC